MTTQLTTTSEHEALKALFEPRAIAIVGASRDPEALSHRVVTTLVAGGFPNPIYPINPMAEEIAGLKSYASLRQAPRPVDVAILAVPARQVEELLDDCHEAGVKAVVCIAAGFAETGLEGAKQEAQLVRRARHHGIRLVGPNCFGMLNTDPQAPMNASFSTAFPHVGNVAIASQSGAIGLALLAHAQRSHFGMSQFVSLGNKADVSSNDLIEHWEHDPRTDVILLYLESFGNPAHFLQITRRVTRNKPVVVLKTGRSSAGARAHGSSPSPIASRDRIIDALLHQAGALRVDTINQLFHVATALSLQPPAPGKRLAVVTNESGPGLLCADAAGAQGLSVLPPSPELAMHLRGAMPGDVIAKNPLDLVSLAGPEHFTRSIPVLLGASEVDALIVVYAEVDKGLTPVVIEAIHNGIAAARKSKAPRKPVFFCLVTDTPMEHPFRVGRETIPVFRYPEEAGRAMAALANYGEWRQHPEGFYVTFAADDQEKMHDTIRRAVANFDRWLPPEETLDVLRNAGLPIPGGLARKPEEAVRIAERLGYPVALKLASRAVTHKTEVDGVQLLLRDETAVREAYRRIESGLHRTMPDVPVDAVIVQPMVTEGTEVFIGMRRDPDFGPILAFGLGGIHVEVLSDVRYRVAPMTDVDARELIRELRGNRLLTGYRGAPAADLESLADLLLRAAWFAEVNPEITSFELAPVVVKPAGQGCVVLDARIELKAH